VWLLRSSKISPKIFTARCLHGKKNPDLIFLSYSMGKNTLRKLLRGKRKAINEMGTLSQDTPSFNGENRSEIDLKKSINRLFFSDRPDRIIESRNRFDNKKNQYKNDLLILKLCSHISTVIYFRKFANTLISKMRVDQRKPRGHHIFPYYTQFFCSFF
jgi:hypothetical protein